MKSTQLRLRVARGKLTKRVGEPRKMEFQTVCRWSTL